MAINLDAMRKHRTRKDSAQSSGGEWFNPQEGEHLLYIAGVCRPNDDLNYVETVVHYNVGPSNNMIVSIDPKVNPIIEDGAVKDVLEERDTDISGACPINKEYSRLKRAGDDDGASRIRRSTKFLFNVIPIAHRQRSSQKWGYKDPAMQVYMCGTTVWEGILDLFFTEGDITDPRKAILVRLVKSGKGLQTRYKISADTDSLKSPKDLGDDICGMLDDELQPGGQGDLYRTIAMMIRPKSQIEDLLAGITMSQDDEKPAPKTSSKPPFASDKTADEDDVDEGGDLDALERELAKRARKR